MNLTQLKGLALRSAALHGHSMRRFERAYALHVSSCMICEAALFVREDRGIEGFALIEGVPIREKCRGVPHE